MCWLCVSIALNKKQNHDASILLHMKDGADNFVLGRPSQQSRTDSIDFIISYRRVVLTLWGRLTHILTIISSNNSLLPGRHQAIIWTSTGIVLIGNLETNFSEILSEIHACPIKKMHLKMSSVKWRQFCLSLNVLTTYEKNTKHNTRNDQLTLS